MTDYSDAATDVLGPVPPPDANDYGSAAMAVLGAPTTSQGPSTAQTAKVAAYAALDTPPTEAAQAQELATHLNLPLSVVQSDIPTYTRQWQAQKNNAVLDNSPHLAGWVAAHPPLAAVAQNDFENLGTLEKLFTAGAEGWQQGVVGTTLANQQYQAMVSGDAMPTPATVTAPTGFFGKEAGFSAFLGGITSQITTAEAQNHFMAAGAALGAAGTALAGEAGGAGPLAGAGLGAVADLAKEAYTTTTGQIYGALMARVSADGQRVDPVTARIVSQIGGMLSMGLTAAMLKPSMGPAVTNLRALIPGLAEKLLTRPTVLKALGGMTAGVAKTAAVGAGYGALGSAITTAATTVALATSPGNWQTVLNNPEARADALNQLEAAAEDLATNVAILHVGTALPGLGADIYAARRADQQKQYFQNMASGADQSALRTAAPSAFRNFVGGMTEGTPQESLYIPAAKILTLYQSKGVTPGAGDPLLGHFVPDIAEQLARAEKTGGDIQVPTADYATHIAPTDAHAGLEDDIRPGVTGYSVNELRAIAASVPETPAVPASTESPDAHRASAQQVYEDAKQQLDDTGKFSSSVTSQYAALIAARHSTRASQFGTLPWDEYQRSNVRVSAEETPEHTADGTPIITDKDIPFAGGTSRSGDTIFIDRHIPQFVEVGGKSMDVHQALAVHEETEKGLMDKGLSYPGAHEQATAAERAKVESMGFDWADYQKAMLKYAAYTEHEKDPSIPRDLNPEPYTSGKNTPLENTDKREVLAATEGTHMQDTRGSITLGNTGSLIRLHKNANLSTFLHESSHQFLHELIGDAARPDAPMQLRDDLQTLLNHWGLSDAGAIGAKEHEDFAAMGERYFHEGKPPSLKLRNVFRRFRAWLSQLYGALHTAGGAISPEIRGVFDRLLATDTQIEAADKFLSLSHVETPLKDLMTGAEFAEHAKAMTEGLASQNEVLTEKILKGIQKRHRAAWREAREAMTAEVTEQVDQRGDLRALNALQRGLLPDGSTGTSFPRLSEADLIKMTGSKDWFRALPIKVTTKAATGIHPDDLAPVFGFSDGHALLDALVELQKAKVGTKTIRQSLIDTELDRRLDEKFGWDSDPSAQRAEAMDAAHNEQIDRALAIELRVLGRQVGEHPFPGVISREWAEAEIDKMRVKDVDAERALRDEAKAAAGALSSALKKDYHAAYLFTRQRIAARALYKATRRTEDFITRARDQMRSLARRKNVAGLDQGYLDRIHQILSRFGLPLRRQIDELSRVPGSLEKFINEQLAKGYDPDIPARIVDGSLTGAVDTMPVADFRDVAQAVRVLADLGRDMDIFNRQGKAEQVADVKAQLIGALRDYEPPRETGGYYRPEDAGVLASIGAKLRHVLKSGDAFLLAQETWFDMIDQYDPMGPFNKYVLNPLRKAQGLEYRMRNELTTRWKALHASLAPDFDKHLDDVVEDPSLRDRDHGNVPFKFTRRRLLAIMLNLGNDGNLRALEEGYGWARGSTEAYAQRNATPDDWRFVKGVGALFESYRDQIDALQRRFTGTGIDFVKPRAVNTGKEVIEGWYFPIVDDPLNRRNTSHSDVNQSLHGVGSSTTAHGFTYSRKPGAVHVLNLDLDAVVGLLSKVIHDLAFREPVADAYKLVSDSGVQTALADHFGIEYGDTLVPWLKAIANNNTHFADRSQGFVESMFGRARVTQVMMGVGFRASTVLKHTPQALVNSLVELGPKWLSVGARALNPGSGVWDTILNDSNMMRGRMDHIDRDQQDGLQRLLHSGVYDTAMASIQHYATYSIAALDMLSAMPMYWGAYQRGLVDRGYDHDDAVAYAEKMVTQAHGSGGIVDLPPAMRGPEVWKMWATFMSFTNRMFNRQRTAAHLAVTGTTKVRAGDFGGARRDFTRMLALTFGYLVVAGLIDGAVSEPRKKNESWCAWGGKMIGGASLMGIPIFRALPYSIRHGSMDDLGNVPVVSILKAVGMSTKDAHDYFTDHPVSKKWLQHGIDTTGYLTGAPLGQVSHSAQFLWDVDNHTQNPQDLSDWYHGLTKGTISKP